MKKMKDEKFGLQAIKRGLKKSLIFLIALWASRQVIMFNGFSGIIFVVLATLCIIYIVEKRKVKREAEEKRWEELGI